MDVYALDRNFQVVSIGIPYSNMQWNRKYYEPGDFAMEIPHSAFSNEWAYIGMADRPELGMVQKVDNTGEGDTTVNVSGFFCEKMLDDKVCYPRYIGDKPTAEEAARAIFERYKEDVPVILGAENSPLLGDRVQSDFSDDQLGTKIFRILESRELSYRTRYDFVGNQLLFEVWQGVDRTQSQRENAFMTFSTQFANIGDKSYSVDSSAVKNYAIIPHSAGDDKVETGVLYLDLSNGEYKRKIVFDKRDSRRDDSQTQEEFEQALLQDAAEAMLDYALVEDINVSPITDSGYMVDYDLGDKVDCILTDVGIELESRIVEVNEVFKAQGHEISVGLGNKRISNIMRAVKR